MKKLLFVLFVVVFNNAFSQENYPFEKWDETVLKDAATAENTAYLSAKEKELVFLINLLRNNPSLFWQTYAKKQIDISGTEKHPNVKTLKNDLYAAKSCGYLIPDADLQKMSDDLAESQEKNGKMGHDRFEARMKNLPQKFKNSYVEENCFYGTFEPIDVVMSWLIDENVSGLTDRKALLNPKSKFIGVSVKPHKKMKNCVVVNFANQTYWE